MFQDLQKKNREGIDYVIKLDYKYKSTDPNFKIIMMNLDTFEDVCLSSHTYIGQLVRNYFKHLRKFINYYRKYIFNSTLNINDNTPLIYVLGVEKGSDLNKIGIVVKSSLRKRLYKYFMGQKSHPHIKFVLIISDPKKVVKCVNTILSDKKILGRR